MSVSTDASDRGRFAAREFLARWRRETGEVLSEIVEERMLFAYEMGYLRGGSDTMTEVGRVLADVRDAHAKGNDDVE